jgi:hypothetical protein
MIALVLVPVAQGASMLGAFWVRIEICKNQQVTLAPCSEGGIQILFIWKIRGR